MLGGGMFEPVPLPEGVYRCDGGLYSFRSELETCPDCLGVASTRPIGVEDA